MRRIFIGLALAFAVLPVMAQADQVNLRCICDNPQGQNISLKIDYGSSRVITFMDWAPGVPRQGGDADPDGSLPAQISDAAITWRIFFNAANAENYQLDRFTGVLRMYQYTQGQSIPGSWHCKKENPATRAF